jgi:hypothetical protein
LHITCHKARIPKLTVCSVHCLTVLICCLVVLPQGKYLRLLQPQQLPTLLKSSLTAQLLSTLLTAALTAMAQPAAVAGAAATDADADVMQQLSPAHAVGLIEGLVWVPRFDMMVMAVGSRDKAALKQLWEAAATGDSSLQERLTAVRSKYRL